MGVRWFYRIEDLDHYDFHAVSGRTVYLIYCQLEDGQIWDYDIRPTNQRDYVVRQVAELNNMNHNPAIYRRK